MNTEIITISILIILVATYFAIVGLNVYMSVQFKKKMNLLEKVFEQSPQFMQLLIDSGVYEEL